MKIERKPFRDYTAESALFVRRALVAFLGILLLSSVLIANLYHLQVLRVDDYRTRSNENRIKLVPIAPSRGIIYDRNGIPLALNRTIYQLELVPEKVENLQATLDALKPIIDLTDDDLESFEKERKRSRRFTSIPVKTGLSDFQVARFAVNQYRFPGVEVKGYQRRYYPYGSALTHVIGYVSKINDKDIERLGKEEKLADYAATHDIGKLGIERHYEDLLHGKPGYEEVEVNNRGRVIRQLHEQPPQAGKDIYLTLDLGLQIYIEKLLAGSRAAVIVTDPRDGGILAMVSTPSYDPNLFVEGISSKDYNQLRNDPNRPLINRATQGVYPPASTVKPYIAVSALTAGVITTNTTLFDPGWWQLPGSEKRFRDWKKWGHGRLNLTKSLEESADTFFYQVAYDMGIDRLAEWMQRFGYGAKTGIDISEESAGNMPTREWKQRRFKKPWYQGDTIPVGIGQGYWTATPIQMNKALTTLINDGQIKTPHLLYSTRENGVIVPFRQAEHQQIGDIHSGYWEVAKDGMYGVANRPNGTARKSFEDAPYKIAAKSGTAQVFGLKENETYNAQKISEHLRDHKLMVAFAPYSDPKVAVSIILENGGAGPTVGTITRQILDHILLGDNTTDLPSEPPAPPGIESE
ncbi:peptidoglycan glycosyltransferase /cell elongation-specific peptidoglycan D,D-transpeptidase|uniref:Peptidoglycan D,D-transpeptidase MrdA n=1 Tax=Brenneria salicis ATCC 15712 = DSM 30166 TaxID=714314 RepID=A0A366ID77_9GAMM|nr:peptidoglycan DD-transpeptidase MrdA [Brenneria salicis]NMN92247.1 peptidoglycan glycosyltransferase /cell elongation-specific peptidoglycan D,D-transpeptidase [Brenneria salicis ATCC 15712 = DSM 30166]RBP67583.1 peptidoglycan glycosyltransferase /cell elongation-specific peptidoglycan D,D-transpeptidase [Brenneria salicis ATCC 15712 = DSM 30166]RLM32430.1 penicillin-binding protein 2 [Brenneria salicis ATCC 15712 = DSM 30166]